MTSFRPCLRTGWWCRRPGWARLALFALFAFGGGCMAAPVGPPPWRITLILYRGCEDACAGFQAYLRQRGVPVEVSLRDVAQDKRKVAEFLQEIRRDKPDLVVTFGTTVTQEVLGPWNAVDRSRYLTDIPVVFMIVSDPVAAKILEAEGKPRPNVTGTLYLLPLETQFKAARSYLPFRRLGYIVNSTESNSVTTRDQLRQLAPRLGFELVERKLPLLVAGAPDAAAIPGLLDQFRAENVDLLYLSPDSFLVSRREALTDGALARQIPVFAAAEVSLKSSRALFGVVNKYEDVGRFTAAQALRVLRDKARPESIAVELPRNFSYLINLPVALQLGRYPPLKLLDVAEIVGIEADR